MIRINNPQYFHFLQQADGLRRSGSLCDAVISVHSQTFRAHRLVLACASRRLAQRLAVGGAERPLRLTLDRLSPRTFQQVLDFTYTQALEVSEEDLRLLLEAAQLLEMKLLEDQCRKQLGDLHHPGPAVLAVRVVKKEAEGSAGQTGGAEQRDGPAEDETAAETSPSMDTDRTSPPRASSCPNSPQSPSKRPRPPPASGSPRSRQSVITRSAGGGGSPFLSPWTFPNVWSSPSTLRCLAESYPSLVAVGPLSSPSPSSISYPISFAGPHVLPMLGPHFPSSVKAFSGYHASYAPNLYSGSAGIRHRVKQGLLKRKRQGQRTFGGSFQSGGLSFYRVPSASAEREKNCSKTICSDPLLRKSATTSSGESCARCHIKGSEDVAQGHSNQRGGAEKPYQCQHCPKRFSLKHQLDTHHRVHTGEKPFECRMCGQRSRDYSAMIKHLRTHGGASPYRCTVCLEFCSSLVAMQRHVKSHPEQDFPPGWSISSTYLYNSHI